MQNYHNVKPVMIGPRLPGYEDLEYIEARRRTSPKRSRPP